MKKLLFVLIILLLFTGCTPDSSEMITSDQLIGKTIDEVSDILVIDQSLLAYGYGFATDISGNPLVLEWKINDEDEILITNATIFDAKNVDNSPEGFDGLEEGMTIFQVVEKVGIPSSIPVTGMFFLEFADSEGNAYSLSWQGDPICLGSILEH